MIADKQDVFGKQCAPVILRQKVKDYEFAILMSSEKCLPNKMHKLENVI